MCALVDRDIGALKRLQGQGLGQLFRRICPLLANELAEFDVSKLTDYALHATELQSLLRFLP